MNPFKLLDRLISPPAQEITTQRIEIELSSLSDAQKFVVVDLLGLYYKHLRGIEVIDDPLRGQVLRLEVDPSHGPDVSRMLSGEQLDQLKALGVALDREYETKKAALLEREPFATEADLMREAEKQGAPLPRNFFTRETPPA